ncbi:MAG TPA: hypothetical protein VE309_06965 [Caulobacteraceae bacterium]|nr:hypothetical protein [Caulobacteraceae bacterium]
MLTRQVARINRKRRPLCFLYAKAWPWAPKLDGDARYIGGSRTGAKLMDLVYIVAGVAIFGLFALYAALLKRI